MTVSPPCRSFSDPSRLFQYPLDERIGEYIEQVVEDGDPTPMPARVTFVERLLEGQEKDWFAEASGGKRRPANDITPKPRLSETEIRCLLQTLTMGYRTATLQGRLAEYQ